MLTRIKNLWAGDVPLKQAFWDYAVIYGLLLNLIADFVFYALLVNDGYTALVVLACALPSPTTFSSPWPFGAVRGAIQARRSGRNGRASAR